MRITSIQYGRVVNLGNYENEKLSAWANVDDGEVAEEALRNLREWVDWQADARHEQETALQAAEGRLANLTSENYSLELRVKEARETWAKARKFLLAVGLELPRSHWAGDEDAEMPF